MTEDELKGLPIEELLLLADKTLNIYVAASIDPHTKLLAEQRKEDINIIHKIIDAKRADEAP